MNFYHCDPTKNKRCKKRDCYATGGSCYLTSDFKCGVTDEPLFVDEGWHCNAAQYKIKEAMQCLKGQ